MAKRIESFAGTGFGSDSFSAIISSDFGDSLTTLRGISVMASVFFTSFRSMSIGSMPNATTTNTSAASDKIQKTKRNLFNLLKMISTTLYVKFSLHIIVPNLQLYSICNIIHFCILHNFRYQKTDAAFATPVKD